MLPLSVDGYVGKALELQQVCEGTIGSSRGLVCLASRCVSGNRPHFAVGENLLDFLELWQVLWTYDGDLRDPLWWPQERPLSVRVAYWPLGIPLPSMPGPKTLCGSVPEPEDSSPVLTWILGFFWSLPRVVSPRYEWGHARAVSSRAVAAAS